MNRKMLLLTLAIPAILSQSAEAQTGSRLVAQADWQNNGAMFVRRDSTAYNYLSSNRGGDLTHQLKYDNATTWNYVDTAYNNAYNYIQEFDSSNKLLSTVTQYWTGTAWVNSTKVLYFYDTANKVSNKIMETWGGSSWVNVAQNVYSYDAAGNVFADQYQLWYAPTSSFTQDSQKVYFYDLSGNVTTQVTQVYNTTLGTYDYSSRIVYSYSSANKLLSTTNSTWNGSAWVNNSMYTNTYDTSGNRTTTLYQTYDTSMVWVNSTLQLFSNFTAAHMPQTETFQVWDTTGGGSWKNMKQYTYTYNSISQLTSATGISWNLAGFWEFALGDPMARYYYGSYNAASVRNIANVGGEANVYPVPTQSTLHIDLKWNEAQSATISIVDMQGRVIRNWETTGGTQYHSAISVNDFAAGVYTIMINGTNGRIVKQLVVTH
jgi:hypothetical protein